MTAAWTALLVMCLGCAVDLAFVWWARATQKLDLWGAVFAAALIQIFGLGGLLIVIGDPTMLVANVAGHSVGSGIGISIARSDREEKED